MTRIKPLPEWWYQDEQRGSREQCRLAGLALHLLDSLPDPEICSDYGYDMSARVRDGARAAGIVIPGTYGYAEPVDADDLSARLRTARGMLTEALRLTPPAYEVARVLIDVALAGIGGPVPLADDYRCSEDEEGGD